MVGEILTGQAFEPIVEVVRRRFVKSIPESANGRLHVAEELRMCVVRMAGILFRFGCLMVFVARHMPHPLLLNLFSASV
jgi:hypothetical protein